MKRIICVLVLGILLVLSGCAVAILPDANLPTDPPSAPSETDPPTKPSETDPPSLTEQLIEEMQQLLTDRTSGENYYNTALTCQFSSPKEIDLFLLFYNGFSGESKQPEGQEQALLQQQIPYLDALDLIRLPKSSMDSILQQYFGIDFSGADGVGLEHLIYLAETDCYYHAASGANAADITVVDASETADGIITVRYGGLLHRDGWVVTLQRTQQGFIILSNLPAGQ